MTTASMASATNYDQIDLSCTQPQLQARMRQIAQIGGSARSGRNEG